MKFFRYKQVCRLNFNGIDDELNDVQSSYYKTKFKLFDNDEINTKLLRFRINGLSDVKLSQNAKVVLESLYLPTVNDATFRIKHDPKIILRFKNISDTKCYDSSNDNNSPIIFAHSIKSNQQRVVLTDRTTLVGADNVFTNNVEVRNVFDNGLSFFNPSPEKLYNFTIPSSFTNNSIFEFELIYEMDNNVNIVMADDSQEFFEFQCSLVIYDEDEHELISTDSNTVDFNKFKPHFPLKKSN